MSSLYLPTSSILFSLVNRQSIPVQHQWVSGTLLGLCSVRLLQHHTVSSRTAITGML